MVLNVCWYSSKVVYVVGAEMCITGAVFVVSFFDQKTILQLLERNWCYMS